MAFSFGLSCSARAIASSTNSRGEIFFFLTRSASPSASYFSYSANAMSDLYLCVAVRPRRGFFQFGGQPEQSQFVAVAGGEVDADRQTGLVPVERQVDRGLSGHVLHRGKRHVVDQRRERFDRVTLVHVERAELDRGQAQRGGEPEIVGLVELRGGAGGLLHRHLRHQVVAGADALAGLIK